MASTWLLPEHGFERMGPVGFSGFGSIDDPATPLYDVTFCVVDLETTGAAPTTCAITEVGAIKLRGGERLGTFQTLVDPDAPVPDFVSALTGITDSMLAPAPPIEAVLPSLLEFAGGAVLVGHNLRFDVSFLDTALTTAEYPPLDPRTVDTCVLARRLLRDEVPNCKLGTLAAHLRLPHQPTHRALEDALATGDLLHALLERAAGFGVFGLGDLLTLGARRAHRPVSARSARGPPATTPRAAPARPPPGRRLSPSPPAPCPRRCRRRGPPPPCPPRR